MASTYTTNLRLTKQGDGDNPNTWGEVLNNVISLVDQAVASYTTVSLGSAATVTLTENLGNSDQSRSAILEFKGSIGGLLLLLSLFLYLIHQKLMPLEMSYQLIQQLVMQLY